MRLPPGDLNDVVSRVGDDWEKLRRVRILLTGGSGFVGRWLIESFSHANVSKNLGAQMSAVSRDPAAFRASAPHIAADESIAILKKDAGGGSRYDIVVHAATPSSATLSGGGLVADVVEETRRVFDLAVASKARRFLYLSSGAVNGRQPSGLSQMPEDFAGDLDEENPSSAYARAKRAGELLCVTYTAEHRLEAVIARGFSFLGPNLPLGGKFAAGSFLDDVLAGRTVRVHGDGTPVRSYLYAGDFAVWLWVILLRGEPGRAYNVGSENPVSIAELAAEAASLSKPPLAVEIARTPDPSRPVERYVPSTARARRELGVAEWLDWREGLRRTHQWHRAALSERPVTVAG